VDLTVVETDPAVDETVRCLVELSKDSLDIIGLALTEVLDKLAKVRFSSFPSFIRFNIPRSYSNRMRITFGRLMFFSPNFSFSRSSPWQWLLDGFDVRTIRALLHHQAHLIQPPLPRLWPPAAVAGKAGNRHQSISPPPLSY
jgi:hypothetical protein